MLKYHIPGPDLESPGQEKKRNAQLYLERDLDGKAHQTGYNWNRLEGLAQDQTRWRSTVDDLCPCEQADRPN